MILMWQLAPSRWKHTALLALLELLFAGCASQFSTRLNLTRQITSATKETVDLLSTVKDKPSAEAAAPKLKALCDRLENLTDQFDALDTEDEIYLGQQEKTVLEEHGKWIAEHMRLLQEEYRVAQISEARQALGETWDRLTVGLFDPGGAMAPGGVMDLGAGIRPGDLPASSATPGKTSASK